jgi:hypothetical protein
MSELNEYGTRKGSLTIDAEDSLGESDPFSLNRNSRMCLALLQGVRKGLNTSFAAAILRDPLEINQMTTVQRSGISTSHTKSGEGTSSIETMSSASSSSRAPRAVSTPALSKVSENDSPVRGADRAAFRRTYSSNSIKVRSVSFIFNCL